MNGGSGADGLRGGDDDDTLFGGEGGDGLYGDVGNDLLFGGDGDDVLHGVYGDDTLYDGAGRDWLYGLTGTDTMEGGLGDDVYFLSSPLDVVRGEIGYSQGGGIDTIFASCNFTLPENLEVLRLEGTGNLNGAGNDGPGTIVGNAGANVLLGRGGNDQINGNDGNDSLTGGVGRDTLVGGNGADRFIFTAIADSRAGSAERDFLNGFAHGQDRINLSAIDANTRASGDQAFVFIGTAAFGGTGDASAGQLRTLGLGGPNAVIVEADHNGDGVADFQIFVNLTTFMTGADFIL